MGPDPPILTTLKPSEVMELPLWARQALIEREAMIEYQRGRVWNSETYQKRVAELVAGLRRLRDRAIGKIKPEYVLEATALLGEGGDDDQG